MSGTWWQDEPERKLTGIVLPSWGDDDPDDDDPAPRPSAPARDPLPGPLDDGWRQETPAARQERLVPVVPSGPPPMWPPASDTTDRPRARVDLPALTAGTSGAAPAEPVLAEVAPPRRAFPRYVAGELVLPGAAEPAATLDARTQPIETGDRPRDALTRPAETWAPQPTSPPTSPPVSPPAAQPGAGWNAAPPRHAPPPLTPTPPPVTPGLPEEADAVAGPTRPLPGVQFTAPAEPRPAPAPQPASPRPAATARTMPPATMPPDGMPAATMPAATMPPATMPPAATMPAATMPPATMPPAATMPAATMPPATMPPAATMSAATTPPGAVPPGAMPSGAAPRPGTPHPVATGIPEADVPPPPRPAPPSIHRAAGPAQDTLSAAQTSHPAAPVRAGSDATTAVQPAVPAAVHAAQQGPPGTGQAPPVPAKRQREGAPHPAFPDATARTMRILPIAADLLPLEITDRRRLRMVRRLVIAGVAACVALLLGWYVVADGKTEEAQAELTTVQDSQRDLNRKKATYTQLESTRQQIKDITTQLGILMERDMSWSALLSSLRKAAPKNVTVANVTGSVTVEQTGTTQDASGDVVGMLTLSGTAPSKDEVAAYVDTLGTVPGLANPFPSEATQDDSGLHFTIRVDITKAALGGRFTSPSAPPSASGGK